MNLLVCKHLSTLESELKSSNILETFNGQAWSLNCRQWIYYDCYIDIINLRKRIKLEECVVDYEYLDFKVGSEAGLYCTVCKDAIIGIHKSKVTDRTYIFK